MQKYLVVYSVGPVQSMISNARKLEDLWAGSYLLSELIDVAMGYVDQAFPNLVQWLQPVKLELEKSDTAQNPNRFLCQVEAENSDDVRQAFEDISIKLRNNLVQQTIEAVKILEGGQELPSENVQQQIFDQIYPFLEIYWAFLPYDQCQDSFDQVRSQLEYNLASVKNDRIFHLEVQYGPVCTSSLNQNALSEFIPEKPEDYPEAKKAVDRYWSKIANDREAWKAKSGEHLSAISSLKRAYRRYKYSHADTFPSVHAFSRRDPHLTDEDIENSFDQDQERYYALVMFDGDDMGKWISGEKLGEVVTPDKLSDISRRLSYFSAYTVKESLPSNQLVKVIYSGGDDVMAVGSIQELLAFVNMIHKRFANQETGLHEKATASCGIVIAHEKTPLQQVVNYAREGETRSKSYCSPLMEQKKNAFSIYLNKRSGEQRVTTLPFTFKLKEASQVPEWFALDQTNLYESLLTWADTIKEIELSRNFINHFVHLFGVLGQADQLPFQNLNEIDMVHSQFQRLILKNLAPYHKDKGMNLVNQLASVYFIYSEDFQNFHHFLEILFYLSSLKKEGERK